MNLHSGKFYWQTTLPNPPAYPVLEENINCDVLIIGGGCSGAHCANFLSDTDLKVVVIDKRKIGTGSTCVNTALIQYLGDKMLFELVNSFGEDAAILHTKLCEEAINDIEKASLTSDIDTEFKRRDSLYYASDHEGNEKLKKEFYFLQKHDFKVDWLTKEQIRKRYSFEKESALYIYNDGEINPFKYTHGLLLHAQKKGIQIFENTKISGKKLQKKVATFYTENGYSIQARYVIIAAGYEGLEFKREKNSVISSTYAVVTNPVDDFTNWYKQTLIWETARPYIYMRTTQDHRIIIGGLDVNTTYPEDRDAKIIHKKEQLIEEFNHLFPNIVVYPEFYLGAFYGGTHDGLPIIGEYEEFPNCYFLFAYGDNGLVYSNALAKIMRDVLVNGSHPAMDLYHQTRS
ncbi:Gamma-glutamylputrescine oxidoreductase [Neobacillus rhizosphaerae]|uniref:Gamma-glutamylputrescine oxidoreductase n=1 Tax=Neobacillus rhizosphaerae TaxID=2880965 RepID=A0ABM9EQ09_9BACI|nr:FAD-dependent oxidoreductase [Neobacillus rhizosphaerae]CAH2714716.1 Gamma-glutamylputrescine oxidoreductase [Neobacillus rhizosphaerae]